MDLLLELKRDIQKYADTISSVINIDVEIMSKSLIRVAGTGSLKNKVGISMEGEAYVYKNVLRTGKSIIIENPRENKNCQNCPSRNKCTEVFEVSTPIIFNSETIGVIGLICFDENQKIEFFNKIESYIKFLKQISMFITSRIYHHNEKIIIENNNKVLLNVVDRIPEAIIITNEQNKVELYNQLSNTIIKDLSLDNYLNISNISPFSDKKEFCLSTSNTTHKVIGDVINFPTYMGRFRNLYVFQESEKFKDYLKQINNKYVKEFIFKSREMLHIYSKILKVAKTNTTVLISGESGTGKEIIAKNIHETSNRSNKPFIPINCGAIPETLIESEFFGYVRGAFTGANPKGKIGLFEQANGGTIFLDEIGDMPYSLQVKLLRVLQEKTITPIGSSVSKKIDVRIISATNKNLEELITEERFREDLYYRLNVFPINLPPLRERPKDIIDITNYFIEKYSTLFGISTRKLSDEVIESFLSYTWPGNIRELKNTVEYIINIIEPEEDTILLRHLPQKIIKKNENTKIKTLAELEKEAIKDLLEKFGTSSKSKVKIAKTLDIGLATLYRKIKLYNL